MIVRAGEATADGLGERLRALRLSKGLTQGDIASRSGFSNAYISKIELGAAGVPVGTLVRLADALEVEPDELAGEPVDLAGDASTGRDEILAAAIELFAARGYSRVSIRELGARAGCSTANLYHHFSSKYDIFVSLIEGAMDRHLAGLHDAVDRHSEPSDQLRHVLRSHLLVQMTRPEVRLLADDFHPISGAARDRFIAERDTYERGIRRIVTSGVRDGSLSVGNPAVALRAALDACNHVHLWFHPDGPLSADHVADDIADFLLAGFGVRSHTDEEDG